MTTIVVKGSVGRKVLWRSALNEMEESLYKLPECPVHMGIPEGGHIFQCVNGHILCEQCYEKLTVCPSCRCELKNPGIRCLLAEQMIECLKNGCIYSTSGCQFKGLGEEVSTHQLQCIF